jgi:hypothetical protein
MSFNLILGIAATIVVGLVLLATELLGRRG